MTRAQVKALGKRLGLRMEGVKGFLFYKASEKTFFGLKRMEAQWTMAESVPGRNYSGWGVSTGLCESCTVNPPKGTVLREGVQPHAPCEGSFCGGCCKVALRLEHKPNTEEVNS